MDTRQQIAKRRQEERKQTPTDVRQAVALEEIADSLEALRIEFAGYVQMVAMRNLGRPGPG